MGFNWPVATNQADRLHSNYVTSFLSAAATGSSS